MGGQPLVLICFLSLWVYFSWIFPINGIIKRVAFHVTLLVPLTHPVWEDPGRLRVLPGTPTLWDQNLNAHLSVLKSHSIPVSRAVSHDLLDSIIQSAHSFLSLFTLAS